MVNKDAKKGKSWKHCRGIRKRQINVRKAIEARLAVGVKMAMVMRVNWILRRQV